ncbi:hypothetical protein T01_2823 [Trichinella spiralis]|uniref:Uncharacterized protein n=1 Tax=Trichinella spiralis TaxID=6334 RepID=A0A0V1BF17_TRISP|nr:hypothetical protein T01_2823 [Trichinella spiralis]
MDNFRNAQIQYAVNRPLQSCHNSCSHRDCLLQNQNLESDLIIKGLSAAGSGHCGQRFSFIPLHPATVETKPINDCYSMNTLHGIIVCKKGDRIISTENQLNYTDSEETLSQRNH